MHALTPPVQLQGNCVPTQPNTENLHHPGCWRARSSELKSNFPISCRQLHHRSHPGSDLQHKEAYAHRSYLASATYRTPSPALQRRSFPLTSIRKRQSSPCVHHAQPPSPEPQFVEFQISPLGIAHCVKNCGILHTSSEFTDLTLLQTEQHHDVAYRTLQPRPNRAHFNCHRRHNFQIHMRLTIWRCV